MAERDKRSDVDREPEAMKKALAALQGLNHDEQFRVIEWLVKKLNLAAGGTVIPTQAPAPGIVQSPATGSRPTAKVFMSQKKPKSDTERVACLAYYLSKYAGTPQFKTVDITKLNSDAALPPMGNPSQAVDNAAKVSQYLAQAGLGKKQITPRGEALVEALPDRDKVKTALSEFPLVKARPRKTKRSS